MEDPGLEGAGGIGFRGAISGLFAACHAKKAMITEFLTRISFWFLCSALAKPGKRIVEMIAKNLHESLPVTCPC